MQRLWKYNDAYINTHGGKTFTLMLPIWGFSLITLKEIFLGRGYSQVHFLSYPYPYHAPVNPTNLVAG